MKLSRFSILFVFAVLLISYLITPSSISVHAQSIPTGTSGITLTSSSNNPVPGQNITITATSYSFDINSATIIWTVGNTQVQKGIGLTTYNAIAPTLGKKTTISVSAITPDGSRYNNSITLGSGSIDMIIESDGYTTPFFKGKVPLAFQNTVTVVAIPHLADSSGKEYNPASLIYEWKKDDGTVLQDQSGFGKQSISLKGNIVPRPYYLIVTASSRDGSAQAQSLILIAPTSPSILFYQNDPLYGPLFNEAITKTLNLGSKNESGAFAALLGFNFSPNIANDLTLDWMINNIEHPELAASQSVILRAPDGTSGTSQIDLSVRGVNNILQNSSGQFNVAFDASAPKTSSTPVTF